MIIGITQRVYSISSYKEHRDSLDQRLIDWVADAGIVPVPIPNTLVDLTSNLESKKNIENWIKSVKINALLLSGGNDIGDNKHRDLTEKCLLAWAETNKIPVLGICRGMQMIGVFSGVDLIEVNDHVKTRHTLKRLEGNFSNLVNSYHNLALEKCPDNFKILALSEDGCIEAIKHNNLPWVGIMWHPEREHPFHELDKELLNTLLINYEEEK